MLPAQMTNFVQSLVCFFETREAEIESADSAETAWARSLAVLCTNAPEPHLSRFDIHTHDSQRRVLSHLPPTKYSKGVPGKHHNGKSASDFQLYTGATLTPNKLESPLLDELFVHEKQKLIAMIDLSTQKQLKTIQPQAPIRINPNRYRIMLEKIGISAKNDKMIKNSQQIKKFHKISHKILNIKINLNVTPMTIQASAQKRLARKKAYLEKRLIKNSEKTKNS